MFLLVIREVNEREWFKRGAKRFFSFRQPLATPLINPAERLKQTTILSASARL